METPSTAIVVCPFTRYDLLPQEETARPICSWPIDTAAGRARLHQVIAGTSETLWDWCSLEPVELRITDLAAHFTSWSPEDRPDEVVAGPMLSLVGPDGIYHTCSPSVHESLKQIILLEGPPPWNPAVVVRVERAQTRSKRTRLCVTLLGRTAIP